MDDGLAAFGGALEREKIGHVAAHRDRGGGQSLENAPLAHENAQLVAAGGEAPRHVPPEEPGPARQEDLHRGRAGDVGA